MCQYSCDELRAPGVPTPWHLTHLGSFAVGGAGLVMTEATAVAPAGRISPQDTGLWNEDQEQAWAAIVEFVHSQGTHIGVQLAHAGRKASVWRTWSPVQGSVPREDGGWQTVGPTSKAFGGWDAPLPLTEAEILSLIDDFTSAATRAVRAGFDVVEIHAAHGYLIHQFLSTLVNERDDDWGGSFTGRCRMLLSIAAAVRSVLPERMPLFVRISATDWVDGGWSIQDSVSLATLLAEAGVDLVDCSSGGAVPDAVIPVAPGYQVPLAAAVRDAGGVATSAVGRITTPLQAEQVLRSGSADAIMMGRAFLRDPRWVQSAAHEFDEIDRVNWPVQYHTALPS